VAIAPLIAKMAKQMDKNVVSFVIMPFKFETNKLFSAGVSLRRVKESSDCLVIVDNDALLYNNPDLTPDDCYRITNDALLEVIGSLASGISLSEEIKFHLPALSSSAVPRTWGPSVLPQEIAADLS